MQIIPAIDIIDGHCVRLSQGLYDQKKVYDLDPLDMAKRYEQAGLKRLHLVDLDGAKSGHVVNLEVLAKLAGSTNLIVDFGGGVKSDADLQAVFDNGAAQVTCGSIAVKDRSLVLSWLEKWGPERLILGADCNQGRIATVGWTQQTDLEVGDFIMDYLKEGFLRVICTDIACDGMLCGPSLLLYKQLLAQADSLGLPLQLVASGGVSSITDLKELEAIGMEAAIVGKAIYEQRVTIEQLVKEFGC